MKLMQQRKAFTLIELLVVIAIIGILAALIIVSLNGARQKASDTQLKNNARNIDTALAQYYTDNNSTYVTAATLGGTEVKAALSNGAQNINSYLSAGAGSAAYLHAATDAKYFSTGATYLQAWGLKASTDTQAQAGNGVYALNNGSTPLVGGFQLGTITGLNTTFASTLGFITYGPQ